MKNGGFSIIYLEIYLRFLCWIEKNVFGFIENIFMMCIVYFDGIWYNSCVLCVGYIVNYMNIVYKNLNGGFGVMMV